MSKSGLVCELGALVMRILAFASPHSPILTVRGTRRDPDLQVWRQGSDITGSSRWLLHQSDGPARCGPLAVLCSWLVLAQQIMDDSASPPFSFVCAFAFLQEAEEQKAPKKGREKEPSIRPFSSIHSAAYFLNTSFFLLLFFLISEFEFLASTVLF